MRDAPGNSAFAHARPVARHLLWLASPCSRSISRRPGPGRGGWSIPRLRQRRLAKATLVVSGEARDRILENADRQPRATPALARAQRNSRSLLATREAPTLACRVL